MFKCGSVILLNNENGNFLSKAVRFFTNSTISHCDFTMGSIVKEESDLSAEMLISVLPLKTYFWDEAYTFTVYEMQGINEDELEAIVISLYIDLAGKQYGFFQLFWFVYKWFVEKYFHWDVRKGKNWFPNNAICSEAVWLLLVKVAKDRFPQLDAKLHEWNQNTVAPQDIKVIVESFPEIFKKKTMCAKTVVTNF